MGKGKKAGRVGPRPALKMNLGSPARSRLRSDLDTVYVLGHRYQPRPEDEPFGPNIDRV